MRADTGSSNTEKVPPKPQHSSGRCGVTKRMPRTPRKKIERLRERLLVDLRHLGGAQRAQRRAAVVQPHLVRELGPGKLAHAKHVVHELDELEGRALAPGGPSSVCSIDVRCVAHVMRAASRRRDDVLVAPEILHEQRLGRGRVVAAAAVAHGLAAACLVERILDLDTEPLEELQRGDADFGEEGVDVARNEQRHFHEGISRAHASTRSMTER